MLRLARLNGKTCAMGSAACKIEQGREIFPACHGKPAASRSSRAGYVGDLGDLVASAQVAPQLGAILMLRPHLAWRAVALVALVLGPGLVGAEPSTDLAPSVGLAIVDFAYVDTSGEPTNQMAAHQTRLQNLMEALRRDFAADGRFHLVRLSCPRMAYAEDDSASANLLRAASDAGAKILVIGGIHKLSTLVQWAKVAAIDIDANRVVVDRLFTFRGDSDEAWSRAELFLSQDIRAALAAASADAR
jgi:hypothetical protein